MTGEANERWLPVVGWEGVYEVSNLGRIKRIVCLPRARPPGVLKPSVKRSGANRDIFYHVVTLSASSLGKQQKYYTVHEIVCRAFHGEKPTPKHEVAHWDGNGENNDETNLRWATKKENQSDSIRHGTKSRGERSNSNKLSAVDIIHIRELVKMRFRQDSLGKAWGVTQQTISKICSGKSWPHIMDGLSCGQ